MDINISNNHALFYFFDKQVVGVKRVSFPRLTKRLYLHFRKGSTIIPRLCRGIIAELASPCEGRWIFAKQKDGGVDWHAFGSLARGAYSYALLLFCIIASRLLWDKS